MKNSISTVFVYPYWMKALGILLIVAALGIFFYRISVYDIMDLSSASFPIAMGLIVIFFSKEKTFDERIAYLKFKALAVAVPVSAMIISIINYYHNFRGYAIETDSWFSVSAFEYLTIAFLIAIACFYYLRIKE